MMRAGALVILMCVLGADSNIVNFFSMIGDEFGVQLENIWHVVKQAIKRPARVKRINHGNVKKTTQLTLPDLTYETETESYTIIPNKITTTMETLPPAFLYYFQRNRHDKHLLLPVITKPRWRTREDWHRMQQPHLGLLLTRGYGIFHGRKVVDLGMSTVGASKKDGDVTTAGQPDSIPDEDIGVMMFI